MLDDISLEGSKQRQNGQVGRLSSRVFESPVCLFGRRFIEGRITQKFLVLDPNHSHREVNAVIRDGKCLIDRIKWIRRIHSRKHTSADQGTDFRPRVWAEEQHPQSSTIRLCRRAQASGVYSVRFSLPHCSASETSRLPQPGKRVPDSCPSDRSTPLSPARRSPSI